MANVRIVMCQLESIHTYVRTYARVCACSSIIHKGTQKICSIKHSRDITNRISPLTYIQWNNVRFLPVTAICRPPGHDCMYVCKQHSLAISSSEGQVLCLPQIVHDVSVIQY